MEKYPRPQNEKVLQRPFRNVQLHANIINALLEILRILQDRYMSYHLKNEQCTLYLDQTIRIV